jgi:hypothetical protein
MNNIASTFVGSTVSCLSCPSFEMYHTRVINNTGVLNLDSCPNVLIQHSVFQNNTAILFVLNIITNVDVDLFDVSFTRNKAVVAGVNTSAIVNILGGKATLRNVTLHNNRANNTISLGQCNVTLDNVVVTNNTAKWNGWGDAGSSLQFVSLLRKLGIFDEIYCCFERRLESRDQLTMFLTMASVTLFLLTL